MEVIVFCSSLDHIGIIAKSDQEWTDYSYRFQRRLKISI